MATHKDASIGLDATIYATREDVLSACERAVAVLGGHASCVTGAAKVTVKIFPGLTQKISITSPLVGVSLNPGDGGSIDVAARIEQYRTRQSRVMFIPVGPKKMSGKSTYLNFLTSLAQELKAIDSGQGSVRRTGNAG
jgi:hypothetical protein